MKFLFLEVCVIKVFVDKEVGDKVVFGYRSWEVVEIK